MGAEGTGSDILTAAMQPKTGLSAADQSLWEVVLPSVHMAD